MENVHLDSQIAGVDLSGYILNASGPKCTSIDELKKIKASKSAAIMTKSCTVLPRNGNPEPRYKTLRHGSLQSMGLPNLGYHAYLDMVPELKSDDKPLIVSISGLSVTDNVEMVKAFQNSDVDLIEVNFSCPNVSGKPQLGYDFEQTDLMLSQISELGYKPLGVKLPAYFDFNHFDTMANILARYPISFISSINSIGNTLVINSKTQAPVIKPNQGFGGLGGSYIKPIGLANVHAFRQRLPEHIQIMGVGGICNGTDAFEYLLAGADAVQVATCFEEEGTNCFDRISVELKKIMSEHSYHSIEQAKGQLKILE